MLPTFLRAYSFTSTASANGSEDRQSLNDEEYRGEREGCV